MRASHDAKPPAAFAWTASACLTLLVLAVGTVAVLSAGVAGEAAQDGDDDGEVRESTLWNTPTERAFERIRDRLARRTAGYEQKGLGVFSPADELSATRPAANFQPLPRGYRSWPTYYRIPTDQGALWIPVPPRSETRGNSDERQWRAGDIRLRLMRQSGRYSRLLDFEECITGEDAKEPLLEEAFEQARREFTYADRMDRFNLWWRMLRTEAREIGRNVPFGRRILALYLLHRKSAWPFPAVAYRNAHVRAFVSPPREEMRALAGGGEEKRWIADAWVAPAVGDPLVHVRYEERDNFHLELTLDLVLFHVAGIRFETAEER